MKPAIGVYPNGLASKLFQVAWLLDRFEQREESGDAHLVRLPPRGLRLNNGFWTLLLVHGGLRSGEG